MLESAAYPVVFAFVLAVVLLVVQQGVVRIVGREEHLRRSIEKGNVARTVLHGGDVLSVFLIAAGVVANVVHGEDVAKDLMFASAFGVTAVLVFSVTSRLGMKALLRARLLPELDRGNAAAGVAAAAHSVATGIITAKAVGGDDWRSLGLSVAFFAIAQATLHLYVVLFRALTSYDDAEEILGENLAAALSYGGITVALSILIGRAVEGTFTGWVSSLKGYGAALVYGLALYVVRQVFVQTILLGSGFSLHKGKLDHVIARERNVAMAALEAASYIGTALALTRIG